MGHLNSSHWWWDVALQGIAGSVVASVFTVVAVLLTLRPNDADRT